MGKRWRMISSINPSTQAVISWIFVSYFLFHPNFTPVLIGGLGRLGLVLGGGGVGWPSKIEDESPGSGVGIYVLHVVFAVLQNVLHTWAPTQKKRWRGLVAWQGFLCRSVSQHDQIVDCPCSNRQILPWNYGFSITSKVILYLLSTFRLTKRRVAFFERTTLLSLLSQLQAAPESGIWKAWYIKTSEAFPAPQTHAEFSTVSWKTSLPHDGFKALVGDLSVANLREI